MIRNVVCSVAFVALMLSAPASAQLHGGTTAGGCISVRSAKDMVTAKGRLTLRHLPGPPNFDSIRHGDRNMLTFILVLPRTTCIDDGGDFADPKNRFSTVHVWTLDPTVHRRLRNSVDKIVTITGEAYARNNALHYAPLVIDAKSVIVRTR